MNGNELGYLAAGLLNGAALGFATCAYLYRRHVQRTAREIAEIIQKGDEVIAESRARLPYDREIQLPDTGAVHQVPPWRHSVHTATENGKVGA